MRVRLGLLRAYLREALTSRFAPTDDDATVPGHLPSELPPSASLDEEAWVPGRWMPGEGEPVDSDDVNRLGNSGMDETDDRMEGDGKGNGLPDPKTGDEENEISDHLRTGEEKTSLGDPPEEEPHHSIWDEGANWLNQEIKRFMLQEYPAGAGAVDPRDPKGFYSDFDMAKDHGDGDSIHGFWSGSPARAAGTDGDPFRSDDPYAQMGFHSPQGPTDGTTPPAVSGEEGVAARKAPEEWTLNAGSDTSKVLGPGAKPPSSVVGSDEEGGEEGDESQEGEEGSEGEGDESGDSGTDEGEGSGTI